MKLIENLCGIFSKEFQRRLLRRLNASVKGKEREKRSVR
jgi:hypothetical protein